MVLRNFILFFCLLITCSLCFAEGEQFDVKKYENACLDGKTAACYRLGLYYEKSKNDGLALQYYDKSCRNKHKLGCLRYECKSNIYASCYFLGDYFSKKEKPELAKRYYKKACDGEIVAGCNALNEHSSAMLLYIMGILLAGGAVWIVAISFFQEESQFKASEALEENTEKVNLAEIGVVLKYSRPFFKRYVSPIVGQMKAKKKIREKYKRVLYSSGLSEIMTPDDFYSFKLFLILGFPIVFMGIRAFLEENWPLSYLVPIAIFGYFYPDIWIKGTIQQRQKEVIKAMPFAVDMLALSVEAGLDFVAAMQKVIEKAKKSPLTDEFQMMIKETKVGASRAEALRNMSWRIDTIEMASFCATLIAADSVGASIGPILKNLSNDIRQKKSAAVEKEGAKATTKILIPMIFFIVPAVLLMIAAPLVSDFTGTGGI